MPTQTSTVPHVALSEPSEKYLCEALFFALMLSSLRRRFPRVHYAFPNFATFCRGEALAGEALSLIQSELGEILNGIAELTHADIFRLAEGENPNDPEIYRQAHYRGRTFDRHRIQEDAEAKMKPLERYGDLLQTIRSEAQIAAASQGELRQEPRSYHRALGPTGFDPQ